MHAVRAGAVLSGDVGIGLLSSEYSETPDLFMRAILVLGWLSDSAYDSLPGGY
jgi:hypothetical protein